MMCRWRQLFISFAITSLLRRRKVESVEESDSFSIITRQSEEMNTVIQGYKE